MASAVLAEDLDAFMLRALAAGGRNFFFYLSSGKKTLSSLKYGVECRVIMGFKRDCNILRLFLISIPHLPINLTYRFQAFSVFSP